MVMPNQKRQQCCSDAIGEGLLGACAAEARKQCRSTIEDTRHISEQIGLLKKTGITQQNGFLPHML